MSLALVGCGKGASDSDSETAPVSKGTLHTGGPEVLFGDNGNDGIWQVSQYSCNGTKIATGTVNIYFGKTMTSVHFATPPTAFHIFTKPIYTDSSLTLGVSIKGDVDFSASTIGWKVSGGKTLDLTITNDPICKINGFTGTGMATATKKN